MCHVFLARLEVPCRPASALDLVRGSPIFRAPRSGRVRARGTSNLSMLSPLTTASRLPLRNRLCRALLRGDGRTRCQLRRFGDHRRLLLGRPFAGLLEVLTPVDLAIGAGGPEQKADEEEGTHHETHGTTKSTARARPEPGILHAGSLGYRARPESGCPVGASAVPGQRTSQCRDDDGSRPLEEGTNPASGCVDPAGASPVSVSGDAPSSRPRTRPETGKFARTV